MKKSLLPLLAVLCLFGPLLSGQIDTQAPHIRFTIGSLGGLNEVRGHFEEWELSRTKKADNAPEVLRLKVAVNSIKTGIVRRDKALMEEEYFNAALYPYIVVEARVYEGPEGLMSIKEVVIIIKGIKQKIDLPQNLIINPNSGRLVGKVQLDRYDWKIGGPSTFSISRHLEAEFALQISSRQ